MSKFLKNGLDNRRVFSLPGNRCVLFVRAEAIARIQVAAADAFLVEDIELIMGEKWNLFNEPDNLAFTTTPSFSPAGTLYQQEISFTSAVQTTAKNELVASLAATKLVAIVQDKNNRWWLVGDEQPLTLKEAPQAITSEANQYSIKVSGLQALRAKQMAPSWVASLTSDSFSPMLDTIDGGTSQVVIGTPADNNGNSGGGTTPPPVFLGNNFQQTVSNPPSAYVIPATVGMVLAAAGTTIKLPASALTGQQHTIKDFQGGARLAAITVAGNGNAIDGSTTPFRINTTYGSITFTYSLTDGWLTNAFIN
jgi:hypothetical protein